MSYIFPAGGQRGTTVTFRVGGHYLHEGCAFAISGPGVEASPRIERTQTIWFEGPRIPLPASQRGEDYPKDYLGTVKLAADAPLGGRYWRVWNSQGVTPSLKFVVGELPEVVEQEIDGDPLPVRVTLPVTINGRIFPREDVDVWTFAAKAGETITAEVHAGRLGSPLDSRLEVRDPTGRPIAENDDQLLGPDSLLRFTAAADGVYELRIHDVNFDGLQHFIYRLTVAAGPYLDRVFPLGGRRGENLRLELEGANLPEQAANIEIPADAPEAIEYRPIIGGRTMQPVLLETGDLPEHLESEPNDAAAGSAPLAVPAAFNGRIGQPGDVDVWNFTAAKDQTFEFDLRAARLGTPLDSVLAILDAEGKELASADDIARGQTDSALVWKAPADGTYAVRVAERLDSRGGEEFAYRLWVVTGDGAQERPGFGLRLPSDAITVERGAETKLKVDVERTGGFDGQIDLQVAGLPSGVTADGLTIAAKQNAAQITFKAAADAAIDVRSISLTGRAMSGENVLTATAVHDRGEPAAEALVLAVAMPTPFKFVGTFESRFAPRGSVYSRSYTLERGGFDGSIEISLADKQIRHLQGVTGPTIVVPPGGTSFEYPVTLAPWMEVGRTSRSQLMAVGMVTDAGGRPHKVTYTSAAQNDQIIILTDPGRLSVEPLRRTIPLEPGGGVTVAVQVGRGSGLSGPVRVSLDVPAHLDGVSAEPIEIPANGTQGELLVRFSNGPHADFNAPLSIEATMPDERGRPVTATAPLTVVEVGAATSTR
ncbi:MAG: PPC domain-containing protein [Planctomycetes bacterium]|nr:PPC domain-containing protein [Planctomycetota bacterium]